MWTNILSLIIRNRSCQWVWSIEIIREGEIYYESTVAARYEMRGFVQKTLGRLELYIKIHWKEFRFCEY